MRHEVTSHGQATNNFELGTHHWQKLAQIDEMSKYHIFRCRNRHDLPQA